MSQLERVHGEIIRDSETGQVIEIHLQFPKCMVAGEVVETILEVYVDGHYHVSQKGNILNVPSCQVNWDGITIMSDVVKQRIVDCQNAIDSVEDYERRYKLYRSLQGSIETLKRFNAKLYMDFAPLSFYWNGDGGWVGGLIFHGSHDGFGSGGAPTFSCCLSATDGWSVHT